MNNLINPPCNSLIATSFTMFDGGMKREKAVVRDEKSSHMNDSGVAQEPGVPLLINSP